MARFTDIPHKTGLLVQSIPDGLSGKEVVISVFLSLPVLDREIKGLQNQIPLHEAGIHVLHVIVIGGVRDRLQP